ncbi:hypothetical protein CEXT_144301 [Caerostris extrusa]|uniref:Uncharacterized protein n=1 Tax=Caerostris extrusa TaxID=172846 RepID=A0AAV4Y8E4_CAEEX|nr:hypothetical protein CEXT_144301 [Caerostris extrusa]
MGIGERRTITKSEKTQTKIFQLSQMLVKGVKAWITKVMPAKDRVKGGRSCIGSHSLPGMQIFLMPDEWLLKASLFSSSSQTSLDEKGSLRGN